MRRYWLSFLMLLLPCCGLATWAIWQTRANSVTSRDNLRRSFCDIAQASASAALPAKLAELREAAKHALVESDLEQSARNLAGLASRFPYVSLSFYLHEAGPCLALNRHAVESVPVLADDARLVSARRREFVDNMPEEALQTYREVSADRSVSPAVRHEAVLGVVSCSIRGGRAVEAGDAMRALLSEAELADATAIQAGTQLLVLLEQAPALEAELLPGALALWSKLIRCEGPNSEALTGRLQEHLQAEMQSMDEQQQAVFKERLAFQASDQLAMKIMQREIPAMWAQLRADSVVDPAYHCDGGEVIVMFPAAEIESRFVCVLDVERLAGDISASLGSQPALAQLARVFAEQFGSIPEGPPLRLDTPWREALTVAMPTFELGEIRLPLARLNYLFLGLAFVLIVLGFSALYVATAKDLRIVRLKSDFVSGVTHELKTPLSLIRMYAELSAGDYAKDEAERKSYHAVIDSECERLTRLIDNILDFAAIEQGRKKYDRQPIDLTSVAERALATFRPQLDREGFTVETDLRSDVPMVNADQNAMMQVMVNLLANAAKYSAVRKHLALRLSADGDQALLSVTDRGIGIPPSEQRRIFEPFYRVETGMTRTTRGAGLGLSLVQRIVRDHGGSIDVISTPGEGSTFRIRLPAWSGA